MGKHKPKPPQRPKQVALAIRAGVSHLEDVCHGILRYVQNGADWRLTMGADYWPPFTVLSLQGWAGDGVIAWLNSQAEVRAAQELGVPVVNCAGSLPNPGIARVTVDNGAVGRLAAEHLLECGFRRFAYFGRRGSWNNDERRRGFAGTLKEAGAKCLVFEGRKGTDANRLWQEEMTELQGWLSSIKTPFGLFTYNDYRAARAMDACRQLGMHLPDDAAVVGVNNDRIACEFCNPPLTSVSGNGAEVGRRAAEMLDRMMAGESVPTEDVLVPPAGVVRRASTDVTAVEDRRVAGAIRYIREHLEGSFGVDHIAKHLDVSRRALEHAFRACLGQTPHAYISHVRVQHAKKLLAGEERVRMSEIARQCGFPDARRLRLVFLRLTGTNPRHFRDAAAKKRRGPKQRRRRREKG